jgi:hypothetical protein
MDRNRDLTIDFLRGTAVLLMIITHVNGLFDGSHIFILDRFTFTGATVCFTTFLFCSSVIYGLKLSKGSISKDSLLRRVGKILLVYYILAFFITIITTGIPTFRQIFSLFIFEELPVFIEFLLAFALFDIVTFIFQKPIKKFLGQPILFILFALLVYFFSRYLNTLEIGDNYLSVIKALLVGHENIHSFGILSYFPIYVLGLIWGRYLIGKAFSNKIALVLGITAYTLLIGMKALEFDWERWPPSVVFHLYGLAYIGIVYFLSKYLLKMKYISNYIVYLSMNTLEYYFLHVIVIFVLFTIISTKFENAFAVILMNILVFFICTIIIYFYRKSQSQIEKVSK